MANEYAVNSQDLTVVAEAIRTKGNTTESLVFPGGFAQAIADIKAGEDVEQATPTITVDSSGLITASATQAAGLVPAGTKSVTQQLPVKTAQTFVPTTFNQSIPAGAYLTGDQIIQGDGNLVAGNIKNGVSIFGVAGSYKGEEITTLYAYNHGDQCTSVTSGWSSSGGATFNSGYVALQGKVGAQVGMYTNGAIDMTPWNTMFVYAEVTQTQNNTGFQGSKLVSTSSGGAAAGWDYNVIGIFTKTIDVSSLSGYFSIHILMGMATGCKGNVYAVYFGK